MFGLLKLLLIALVVAVLGLSGWLFVWPEEDSPRRADAVVVLAGAREPRLEKGLELVRRGIAPVLVISDAPAPYWPEANRLCREGGKGYRVVCFRPEPYSTRGEAQDLGQMAKERRWRRLVVVTSTFHVTRSRLLFDRCVDGEVELVGAPYSKLRLPQYVFSEWVKLAYAQVRRGC